MHDSEVVLRIGLALLGREPEPPHRFGVVFWHAFAVVVHDSEVVLRIGIALLGREPEPPHRFGVVFWHAFAVVVHDSEVVLRIGLALLGREPIPPHRFCVILWHAFAVRVHDSEVVLRIGIALFCFGAVEHDRGFVVASFVCGDCVVNRPGCGLLHGRGDDERRDGHQDPGERVHRYFATAPASASTPAL